MARPNRIKEKAAELGISDEVLVARALRQGRTLTVAKDIIGVSLQSLSRYVNAHPDKFNFECHWNYTGNIIDAEIINEE